MKKLMVAAAIVCAAAISQAAYVNWSSGDFTELATCTEDLSDTCVKMYVWEFGENPGYASAADVWNAYKNGNLDTSSAIEGEYNLFGGFFAEGSDEWTEPNTVYGAILFLHNDEGDFDNPDYYMANIASAAAANAGADVYDLGNMIGGDGAETVWTATPEPTTGMLMLFGLAGLALKRKRA